MGEIVMLPPGRRHRPAPPNPLADPKVRTQLIKIVDQLLVNNEAMNATLAKLLVALNNTDLSSPAG